MKNDITSVINGNITGANISPTAAIPESKITFDPVAGHDHDGVGSHVVAGGNTLRADITGMMPKIVAADTARAESGAMELNGVVYTLNQYSTTRDLDTNADWVEGAEQSGPNITFYMYAYNDTGTEWDVKFWLQAPQYANCGTDTDGTLIFRQSSGVWYRCIGVGTTDAAEEIDTLIPWGGAGGGASSSEVQLFDADGTWTKPAGVTIVEVHCVGGGAGGAGGVSAGAGMMCPAGSGGGGGARIIQRFRAVDLSATETVVIGLGGAGAASSGAGTTGGNGGTTTFGTTKVVAYGGGGGVETGGGVQGSSGGGGGGIAGVGAVGVVGADSLGGSPSYTAGEGGVAGGGGGGKLYLVGRAGDFGGGSGGGVSTAATALAGGLSVYGGGGGGSGGSVAAAGTFRQPGAGGASGIGAGGAAGVTADNPNATAGSNGTDGNGACSGSGGGGGGGCRDGAAGKGGNGGSWGGGGGGGGITQTGTTGAGGAGGKGGCVVYAW
jgi:hypothetical protein